MRYMSPSPSVLVVILAGAIGILAVSVAARQVSSPAGALAPAEYKNIQVLTDVPARQILATMDYFVAATGHGCADCHQRGKPGEPPVYEVDTPNKTRAREMIRLVKEVNAGGHGVTISCATCHAGHVRPPGIEMMTPERVATLVAARGASAPARPASPGAGGPPAGDAPAPSVDAILAKYFDAIGGAAAVDALPATVESGTIVNAGTPVKADMTIGRHGEKFVISLQVQGAPGVQRIGFDGAHAWLGGGPTVLDAPDRTFQKAQVYGIPVFPTSVRRQFSNLASEHPQTIRLTPTAAPVTVNVLSGSQWQDVAERMYFDATTGLLLRRQWLTRVALGGTIEEWMDYDDYQPFAGVKLPRAVTQTTATVRTTLTVTDIKNAAESDDSRFDRPKGPGGS